jgi:hypothetical protein
MSDSSLSPAAVALAARMYDAARAGQLDIFEQALPAGLPANMTNEKGDSLVSIFFLYFFYFFSLPNQCAYAYSALSSTSVPFIDDLQ